jgi:undecaprenyl-diphosphatase
MGLVEIIVLAIVQGLTEFLPVSSSGHLVVASAVLDALGCTLPPDDELLAVEIVLHLGTLLAILLFFWREVRALVGRDRRLIPLLIVGTLPAVAVGLPLKYLASGVLVSPLVAGCLFPVTALLLMWASRRPEGSLPYREMGYGGALIVGLMQTLALLPGISRSGATIAGGLFCGLDRRSAGVFAFLLGIPAMAGAGALEVAELAKSYLAGGTAATGATQPALLVLGLIVSLVVGLVALAWLIRWVQQGRLTLFAWYLFPLGVAVVVWQLFFAR